MPLGEGVEAGGFDRQSEVQVLLQAPDCPSLLGGHQADDRAVLHHEVEVIESDGVAVAVKQSLALDRRLGLFGHLGVSLVLSTRKYSGTADSANRTSPEAAARA